MEFGILGSLEVFGPEGPVKLGGAKRRGLLAYLLVRRGQAASLDALVEALWGERPTSGARGTVQTYLSQLRSLFAARNDVSLERRPDGYTLEAGSIDAARFEWLCAQAAAAREPRSRVRLLDEALALWRGPPLAEFAGAEWADLEATRLEALHLQALQQRLDSLLALGRHVETIPDLERFVDDYRLDEHFWAQLMVAYYRSGRQADALGAYQQVRSILADELGIEPGAELADLERKILDHDPSLRESPGGIRESPPPAEPPAGLAVPFPVRLVPPTRLVDRESELAILASSWNRACAGECRLVFITGEPGIGKTALAAHFAAHMHAEGAPVLYGRCDEELGASYGPFVEPLRQLVRSLPEEALRQHVTEHGAELSRLVPELARRLPEVARPLEFDPDTERYPLVSAVAGLFSVATLRQPIVLVLDDLQWANERPVCLLRHLVRSSQPLRLLILAAYDESDLPGSRPLRDLLAALRTEPGIERITLGGLGDDEVAALIAAAADQQSGKQAAELAHEIRRETDGNPFFVAEVLHHLVETGVVHRHAENHWEADLDLETVGLPDSIREVVSRRVERLGHDARSVLTSAAVIGREFDFDVLTLVETCSEEEILDVLDAATTAAIVRETRAAPGRYTFNHSLIQHTLYQGLAAMRRRRSHRRVAEALEEISGEATDARVEELAHHWALATSPAEGDKAVRYARRAGELALDALAPREAITWLEQALARLDQRPAPDDETRCRLLVGLGVAQRQAGLSEHRETLLTAARLARRSSDTEGLVQAVLADTRGQPSFLTGPAPERIEAIEAALSAVESGDSRERARLLALLAVELTDRTDWHRRRELTEEAVAMARRLDDPVTLVRVINLAFQALWVPETLALRAAWSSEALQITQDIGDPALRWAAMTNRMWTCVHAGDFDELDRLLDAAERMTERLDEPFLRFDEASLRAIRSVMGDSLAAGERALEQLLDLATAAPAPETQRVSATLSFALATRRGDPPEPSVQIIQQAAAVRSALAAWHCHVGPSADAQAMLGDEQQRGFHTIPYDRLWLGTVVRWARVAAAVVSRPAAEVLYATLLPYHDHLVSAESMLAEGSVAHDLGLLARALNRYEEAAEHFAEADALYERIGSPFLSASNKLERARLHQDLGENAAADALLDDILTTSAREGFKGLEHEAVSLKRTRKHPPRR